MLVHAGVPGFAGGYIGVDVFFVLSGYLITGLLWQEFASTGSIRYLNFLARRLKRLLPAMLLMLFVVAAITPFLLSAYETRMQTGSFRFAATWTSNFFFAFAEFDYFAALKQKDLFLHTWSLGIEEQFYIVWPWLIVATLAATSARHHSGHAATVLFGLLAAVFAASLALCLYWASTRPLFGFYMMPSRGWQFALGAIVFIVMHPLADARGVADSRGMVMLRQWAGIAGTALVVGSAMLLHAELAYPGAYALMPSFGAAAVIFAGANAPATGVNRLLASRPLVWVGDRSYSLYLWHWPLLLLGEAYGLTSTATRTALLVALSVAMSSLSYRFVELPFWKGRLSKRRPATTFAVSVLAIVCMAGSVHAFHARAVGAPAVGRGAESYDPRLDAPAIYTAGFDCDTHAASAEVKPCSSGPKDARHTAVLIGDSIGAQWVSILPEIYAAPDWQVLVLTKSSCPIIDEEVFYEVIGEMYVICTEWRNAAIDYIVDLEPDVLFVGTSSNYIFSEQQWVGGTERVLTRLAPAVGRIAVIAGTPALSFDGPSCVEQPYRFSFRLIDSRRECEERLTRPNSIDVSRLLGSAVSGFENVELLDLNDLVCPDQRCAAQTAEGLSVFRDNQHLTVTFVVQQVSEIRRRLEALGMAPVPQQRGARAN